MRNKLLFTALFLLLGTGIFLYLYNDGGLFKKIMGKKDIAEGVIEYDITYPKIDPKSMMISGMPDKAYLRFKDNNTVSDMSAMMGLVSIGYISNQQRKSVEQRLALFSNKYAAAITEPDLKRLNDSYVSSVEEGGNFMKIAEYKCKEALVKLSDGEQIKVYYTNDISIVEPNWSNPYNKINGVLMDFQMERYGVVMHLRAKSVISQKIDDEVFAVPADTTEYKKIAFDELEKILQELNPSPN